MDPSIQQYVGSSPQQSRPPNQGPNKKLLFVIVGGVIALLIAVVLLVATSGGSPTQEMQRLSARLETLTKVVEEGQQNITGGELRRANSDLYLVLLTTRNDVGGAIAASGGKAEKEITALEADSDTFTDLEEASANGRFDAVYAEVIDTKIDATRALMQEVHTKSKDTQLKAVLTTAYNDLGEMQQRLSEMGS